MEKCKAFAMGASVVAVLLLIVSIFSYSANVGLKGDLETAQGEISSLESDKNSLEIAVDGLTGKVDAMGKQLEAIAGEALAKDSEIQALEETIAGMSSEYKQLEEEKQAIESELELSKPVEYNGYVVDEISLNAELNEVVDDGELDGLFDDKVEVDNEKYDAHEEIVFSPDVKMAVSGLGNYEEEFAGNPYIVFMDDWSVAYRFIFDDPVPVEDISDENPLDINFLGRDWSIVEIDDNELVLRNGDEEMLEEGDLYVYGDDEIEFIDAGDDEAIFYVNGKQVVIQEGDVEKVDGLEIYVKEIIPTHSVEKLDLVFIYVSSDVDETFDNGDDFTEEPDWYMHWALNTEDELVYFDVSYMEKSDELDDDFAPLGVGDCLAFPYEAFEYCFVETTPVEYLKLEFSFDEENAEDDLTSDTSGMWLEASETALIVDNEEVDKVFLVRPVSGAWEIYYENDDGDFTLATTGVKIDYEDTEFDVVLEASGSRDFVINDGFGELRLDVRPLDEKFGNEAEEPEATDVKYDGNDFGTYEEDVLTPYGVLIKAPDNSLDDDKLEILIPSEQVEATTVLRRV